MNYVTPSWLSVFKSFKNFIVKINIDIFFSASIEFIQQGILLLANPNPLYPTLLDLANKKVLQNYKLYQTFQCENLEIILL